MHNCFPFITLWWHCQWYDAASASAQPAPAHRRAAPPRLRMYSQGAGALPRTPAACATNQLTHTGVCTLRVWVQARGRPAGCDTNQLTHTGVCTLRVCEYALMHYPEECIQPNSQNSQGHGTHNHEITYQGMKFIILVLS